MAEGEGFEPSIRGYPYNDLANRRLQPLGHPSAREWVVTTYADAVVPSRFAPVNPAETCREIEQPGRETDQATLQLLHRRQRGLNGCGFLAGLVADDRIIIPHLDKLDPEMGLADRSGAAMVLPLSPARFLSCRASTSCMC